MSNIGNNYESGSIVWNPKKGWKYADNHETCL